MSPRNNYAAQQSQTATPATVTYDLTQGSQMSSPGSSCGPSVGLRNALVVDWDVDLPLEPTGHLAPSFNQILQVPNSSHQYQGTVSCVSIAEGNIATGIKIRVDLGYPANVELRVFGQMDAAAPFINLYAEGHDVPEFTIPNRTLSPLLTSPTPSPSEPYTHACVLLSFSISAFQGHNLSPTIYESTSPAALHRLTNFLDQPGGHDVVFCFPDNKHLYADQYILQRCSPYFRRLFQMSPRGGGGGADMSGDSTARNVHSPATPRGRGSDKDSGSVRSLGSGDDGFESEDITIQNSEEIQTPGTSVPSSNGDNSFPLTADPARVPLPRDSPTSADKYTLQRTPSPLVDDNVIVMDIKETSFNTFRAFLYYLYTDFISFAPLTSCFHHAHPFPSKSSKSPRAGSSREAEEEAVDRRRLEARNAVVSEYMRKHPTRPVPVSPKSIYAIAKKYEVPALEEQSIIRITSISQNDPIVAVGELFSAFSRVHTPARQAQLNTVIASWEIIVRRSGEWEVARARGVKVADAYFATILCEILDRLP